MIFSMLLHTLATMTEATMAITYFTSQDSLLKLQTGMYKSILEHLAQNTMQCVCQTTKPYLLGICVQLVLIVEEILELNQCFILVCGWQTHYSQQITQNYKHKP